VNSWNSNGLRVRLRQHVPSLLNVDLPTSKSISNRILLLHHLYGLPQHIAGLSEADDTVIMRKQLRMMGDLGSSIIEINAGDAGTVGRFLLAMASVIPGEFVLTGSSQLRSRPMGGLVALLVQLGAEIRFLGQPGYLPLHITGGKVKGGVIRAEALDSSQFISALLMIAPALTTPTEIHMSPGQKSFSYIQLTLQIMKQVGLNVHSSSDGLIVYVEPFHSATVQQVVSADPLCSLSPFIVESDWSGASFFAFLPLLLPESTVFMKGLRPDTCQGDGRFIIEHASRLGLGLKQEGEGVHFFYHQESAQEQEDGVLFFDMSDAPDLALNLAVVLALKGKTWVMSGLETLRNKESDRIQNMHLLLRMAGCDVVYQEAYTIKGTPHLKVAENNGEQVFSVQADDDHRVAMAAAYFAIYGSLELYGHQCVKKSFPGFWNQVENVIFDLSNL
jgi:3-phosphoshikimate 1-carboxyvinyltransferase